MSREFAKKIWYRGELRVETPLAIGTSGVHPFLDAPLARDGQGRYFIPGSSLAGVLRANCQTYAADDWVQRYFGTLDHASRLMVADAIVKEERKTEVLDHVSIDRWSGAAADQHKFDQQVWQPGTRFEFYLSAELKQLCDECTLDDLIRECQAGELRFGAKTSRGQGKLVLIKVEKREMNSGEMLAFLRGQCSWRSFPSDQSASLPVPAIFASPRIASPRLDVEIAFNALQPIMMKASQSGQCVETLPRMRPGVDGKYRLHLSGHAIAGVLRTRAEKIIRTRTLVELKSGCRFLDQFNLSVVNTLFGAPKPAEAGKAMGALTQESQRHHEPARRSLLRIEDCEASNGALTRDEWRSLGDRLTQHTVDGVTFKPSWHVALDRWTQAPKSGALFSVLLPLNVEWSTMRLRLEKPHSIDPKLFNACLALLLYTLADLYRGELAFGFGTRRGLGSIACKHIALRPCELAPWPQGCEALSNINSDYWSALFGGDTDPIGTWLSLPASSALDSNREQVA